MDSNLAALLAPLQLPPVSVEESARLFKVLWTTHDMDAGERLVRYVLGRALAAGYLTTSSMTSPAGEGKETASWSLERGSVGLRLDVVRSSPDPVDNWCGISVRVPRSAIKQHQL